MLKQLEEQYQNISPEHADVIVALGGDGFMLRMLHHYKAQKVPIYGMNCGSVGFLMNERKNHKSCSSYHSSRASRSLPTRYGDRTL